MSAIHRAGHVIRRPLNLNQTSLGTSLLSIILLNLSQSSPGGIRRMNCSSNVRSSSSESNSRSYGPRKDVPDAWRSLTLSLSLGWNRGRVCCVALRIVRSEDSTTGGVVVLRFERRVNMEVAANWAAAVIGRALEAGICGEAVDGSGVAWKSVGCIGASAETSPSMSIISSSIAAYQPEFQLVGVYTVASLKVSRVPWRQSF